MPKDNIVNGVLVTDIDESYVQKDIVTRAVNSNLQTSVGNSYFRTNEQSNELCVQTLYPILHVLPIKGSRKLIISTDNEISEFGVVDEKTCEYETLFTSSCLGLNLDYPISSTYKENEYGEEIITFSDANTPVRRINLQKIPYTYTVEDDECQTKTFTNQLDCSETLLFKKIQVPELKIDKGFSGNLPNGMWSAVLAYAIDGEKYSDYYALQLPIALYSEGGGNALDINVSGLDLDFRDYQIVVIGTVKGVTTAKLIGTFPTSLTSIQVTDFERPEYITIPLENLVINKIIYEKAGIISNNSEYLILADLTKKEELNIQRQLEDVKAEYTVTQYPITYYRDGGDNVGHYRDEVYSYYIRYLYDTGDFTSDAILYGRKAESNEKALASGADLYEALDPEFNSPIELWQIENTAGDLIKENNEFINGSRFYGFGQLGYHESSFKYEDNRELYGDNACTPIRLFRMPDESKVPRFSIIDGVKYINVLGIRFKNIPHPVDSKGNPVKNIVGYEILRADRAGGNRTIVARGMMTNTRFYNETQGQAQTVAYANYGVNYLGPDAFLSSKQTRNQSNRERDFIPLTGFYLDKFNFFSPHGVFNSKYRMGREFVFETEETARIEGFFEPVFNHPKDYLITNFSLYLALIMGAIQGLLVTLPQIDRQQSFGTQAGITGGASFTEVGIIKDTIGNSPIFVLPANLTLNIGQITKRVLQTLAKAGMFIYFSAEYASNALRIIKNYSQLKNYAIQYNGQATFEEQKPIVKGLKRRQAKRQPEYLGSGLHTIENLVINNFNRPSSVFVEFPSEYPRPSVVDNSVRIMTEANVPLERKFRSSGSAYYVTSKIKNPGQYGSVGSVRKVKTSNNVNKISLELDLFGNAKTYNSPILYGGDCIIAEFSYLNKLQFFSQDVANSGLPDGTIEYNYRLYRNLAYPRFWADFSDYELGNLISQNPSQGRLPANKHNLDNRGNTSNTAFTVEDKYFYLYHNTAITYVAECDYNIWFREKTEVPHYSRSNSNLSSIFRSDKVKLPEEFKLDPSFAKLQAEEFYSQTVSQDFDSKRQNIRDKNALIYSLPSFKGQTVDNWLYFLPGNYFSFNNTDFGNLTGVHKLDQDKIIFLFDKASPYISMGRDELQTEGGRKITIGDGGLFAQQPRELIHTDIYYGSTQSRFAFSSTPFGSFYPSARAGRLFKFTGQLDDISREGMHFWCKNFMPIKLMDYFPEYDLVDNTVNGVGYSIAYDAKLELVYFSKRDFIPTLEDIEYVKESRRFEFRGTPISLRDPIYFKDVSWTLSYSPSKGFNSWHTWYPDLCVQTENHFMTVKGNTLWKHNERVDDYCTFYGVPQNWEVQVPINTGKEVHLLQNFEYQLEARIFRANGLDTFHKLGVNFDNAYVENSEQHSGVLNLIPKPVDIYLADTYPKFNFTTGGNDITFDVVENKYRFNQFLDLINDRGKYPPFNEYPIWINSENGVDRILNPKAIDYNKPSDQRKRFRHYLNKVSLLKKGNTPYQMIFKFLSAKIKQSPR